MPERYDYIEWDVEDAEAERRRAEEGAVGCLYDRKIRVRIGELIARAMRIPNKQKL